MFIVDSQVHIWKEETPDRPWIPGARERMKLNGHRTEAFSYEECLELMDEAGVDRAFIVPPSWEGDRINYALEACEAHPDRFGIMARIPQNKPAEAKAMRKHYATTVFMAGLKIAAFVSIPVVNLATPLFGMALMVNMHKRLSGPRTELLDPERKADVPVA